MHNRMEKITYLQFSAYESTVPKQQQFASSIKQPQEIQKYTIRLGKRKLLAQDEK